MMVQTTDVFQTTTAAGSRAWPQDAWQPCKADGGPAPTGFLQEQIASLSVHSSCAAEGSLDAAWWIADEVASKHHAQGRGVAFLLRAAGPLTISIVAVAWENIIKMVGKSSG
jgi:hypothetical protein